MSKHFPELTAFRENDDLILVRGEARRLFVRRTGPDRFLTSENMAASGSTNLLGFEGGVERDLDALIDLIEEFAGL